MTVINDLGFFFSAFGKTLEILGAILMISVPSLGAGFYLGWKIRKNREPESARVNIEARKKAEIELSERRENDQRVIRYLESADSIEAQADERRIGARAARRLGIEVLRGGIGLSDIVGRAEIPHSTKILDEGV